MHSALVLSRGARHAYDSPCIAIMLVVGHQPLEQPLDIEPIRLGAPTPTIDLDARWVDDDVFNLVRREGAVNPESITSRLVAAEHSS